LQHLRFLVIDEADRLLSQSYQGWIDRVCRAADIQSDFRFKGSVQDQNKLVENEDGTGYIIDPLTWRRNDTSNNALLIQPSVVPHSTIPLRKLLFSATLTKDPQKLAPCGLVHPKHYDARLLVEDEVIKGSRQQQQQYSLPDLLKEFLVHCTAEQKPLVTISLILDERLMNEKMNNNRNDCCIVVIFTASLDSTHRLARLLQLLWARAGYGEASEIAEYSSALSQKQRERLLQRCSDGSVAAIVCSDGMSRGMDIPAIRAVINYDIPNYAKTYVHRCGRTARAGREGKAISILSLTDEKKFVRMRELIARADHVKEGGVNKSLVTEAVNAYSWCTSKLQEVLKAEKDGLNTLIPLGKEWYDERSSSEEDDYSDSSYHSNFETDGLRQVTH
jgi:ATP-dependent RNA helicase DDX51/DBP6